jgi:penicillin-binding protein 1A
MPALEGLEYFANVHMRDADYTPGFRTGLSRFSTSVWVTHAWRRTEFLNALAERAEFSIGGRGVDHAARVLFDRSTSDLNLPQAALIAAMIGERRVDPWCNPEAAANMRRRVLERMLDDGAIDESPYHSANVAELGLMTPPPTHKPCVG